MEDMILTVNHLCKSYPQFSLSDVSFSLPKGAIMGLIGENGAGKSTTMKLILGMTSPDSGSISVFGHAGCSAKDRENIGVVFDELPFAQTLFVSHLGRIMKGIYQNWDQKQYEEYLQKFALPDKKELKDFSRGMKMKLSLAVALSHNAKLLILDEPTSGLDPVVRAEILDIFLDFISDGEHSVLFSTHITVDLERAADFITYITGGRLYYTGPKDEFEESFRIVKGGPGELAQLPAGVVLGSHTYQTGFDALVRSDSLGTVSAAVADIVVEPASIDDIIRLTNVRDSVASSPEAASALKEVGHGNVD